MRVLIFGTCYIANEEREWLVDRWMRVMLRLNREAHITIIDSQSPVPIPDTVGDDIEVWSFDDNIGHLGSTGRDGWGRAFCQGLQDAIEFYYDYVVLVDTDILFARPVGPICDYMKKNGIKYGTVSGAPYTWAEGGIAFIDVAWMKEIDFIARYDWPNMRPGLFPEYRLMDIAGPNLHYLDIPGRRNDDGLITADNAGEFDWVTHAPRDVYEAFLRAHGMGDLV